MDGVVGGTQFTYLIFERYINSLPILDDQWVTDTVTDATILWNSRALTGPATPQRTEQTLAAWKAAFPNAVVCGFSSGIGSGWSGTYDGAVDDFAWTFGATTTATGFIVLGSMTTE